jgi:catechol 2,3-dioxygenase-like lactoylglutathione lyase family enzyme
MAATVKRLDHVNLRTANLERMIAWYGRVLDMHPGPRPGFDFPGAWLYADGHPIVHLVGAEMAPRADPGDLRLGHFAISASGLKELLGRLDDAPRRLSRVPDFDIVQVNIHDPDGNYIHIDFDAAESEGLRV